MAGIDDLLKNRLLLGAAIGVGVVLLAPLVAPSLSRVSRPLAKSLVKAGLILYDKGREAGAELSEVFEDLLAEARAELAGAGDDPGGAAGDADTTPVPPAAAEA